MMTERLEEFRVLAHILNYSKAAEKLFISQSVLSRHIHDLEEETGAVLFLRDTHGVQLTDEGKYFLRWIEPLLDKASRIEADMAAGNEESVGTVCITCAEQTLNTAVLSFFSKFAQRYPEIDCRFSLVPMASSREMVFETDLLLSQSDFGEMPLSGAESIFLCAQEPLLAIPPFHHFGDKQEIRLEELTDETIIVPFDGEIFSPYPRNALLTSRKCRGQLRRISAESAEAGLLLVELSKGVMLIPHHLKHRVYPHTRTIPVQDTDCLFPIYAYRNQTVHNDAADLMFRQMRQPFGKASGIRKSGG